MRWSSTFQTQSSRKKIKSNHNNYDKIRNEKPQYNINGEAAKILTLSSDTIDKYEYSASEEILPSDQKRMIEKAFSLLIFDLGKHV